MSNLPVNDCNHSDVAWKHLLRARDPNAIECIWTKINEWCYTTVKRYCGDENTTISAAIESLEKILQKFERQDTSKGSFLGFCRTICVNEVLDQCKRRNKLRDDIYFDALEEVISEGSDPALLIGENVILSGLNQCLDQLTVKERQTIDLLYLAEYPTGSGTFGLPPEEVAAQMKITRTYVNKLACDARKKLLACLRRRGFNRIDDFLALFGRL